MAEQTYNDPSGGTASSVGPQLRTDYYQKKALIEAAKESYFGQLADTTAMPKNMGKTIKRFHYLPILDDANINDQGLDAAGAVATDGNLYGSSKDIGFISGKLPALSETGGRVNRVGMTRFQIEGTITKYGFFEEYTKESLDFDTDAELEMHINSEMVKGANEMTEDMIQMDLLAGAGVLRFGGAATSDAEVSGEAGEVSVIDYNDLMRLEIDLDNNRCPKNTKIITGSRMVDTKVIDGARYIYVGSEMIPSLKKMTDNFANQAFISVASYGSAGSIARGEIGSIGGFRVIVVPEMLHWAGAGKAVTTNTGYRETNNAYDIYPMLVVGSGSFTTIGFQTDGKTTKFKIKHVKPESEGSYSSSDPFGEMGFMSIKWYYGSMILRPERIALVKTVAEY